MSFLREWISQPENPSLEAPIGDITAAFASMPAAARSTHVDPLGSFLNELGRKLDTQIERRVFNRSDLQVAIDMAGAIQNSSRKLLKEHGCTSDMCMEAVAMGKSDILIVTLRKAMGLMPKAAGGSTYSDVVQFLGRYKVHLAWLMEVHASEEFLSALKYYVLGIEEVTMQQLEEKKKEETEHALVTAVVTVEEIAEEHISIVEAFPDDLAALVQDAITPGEKTTNAELDAAISAPTIAETGNNKAPAQDGLTMDDSLIPVEAAALFDMAVAPSGEQSSEVEAVEVLAVNHSDKEEAEVVGERNHQMLPAVEEIHQVLPAVEEIHKGLPAVVVSVDINSGINMASETSGEAPGATPHEEESWFIKGVRVVGNALATAAAVVTTVFGMARRWFCRSS